MSRHSAVWVLVGFALAAVAVALWGASDISIWMKGMAECNDRIEIDTSSFWFIGILSLASLPFFALFQAPRVQKMLLIAMVLWFITAPIAVHRYFVWKVSAYGYYFPSDSALFTPERTVLLNQHCTQD